MFVLVKFCLNLFLGRMCLLGGLSMYLYLFVGFQEYLNKHNGGEAVICMTMISLRCLIFVFSYTNAFRW